MKAMLYKPVAVASWVAVALKWLQHHRRGDDDCDRVRTCIHCVEYFLHQPRKTSSSSDRGCPKIPILLFFLNCSNWGGQRTDWHGLLLATLLRRKRSWEDMEGGWALHHMEYVRTFGTFFRMASFITSAIVLNHHGCVTVKANFAGDASRISVGNMRRISLGNMRRISVQNMRGNSIIPDMSFRPHLLNDLRSLENNRGMSKVVNMFFSLKRLLIYIWDYVFYGQPPSVFYPTP